MVLPLHGHSVCETGMQIWISKSRSFSQMSCSFARKSFLNLRDCMVPGMRHYLWLISLRAMLHMPALLVTKMNLNPGGSVRKLQDDWFVCVGAEFLSRWYFLSITQPILTNLKASGKFSPSGDYWRQGMLLECKKPKVCSMESIECCGFHSSLISWNRNPVFWKSLKQLGICASSCPNFTVNSS